MESLICFKAFLLPIDLAPKSLGCFTSSSILPSLNF